MKLSRTFVLAIALAAPFSYAHAQKMPPLDAFGERAARAFSAVANAPVTDTPLKDPGIMSVEEPGQKASFAVGGPMATSPNMQAITCEKSQFLALLAGSEPRNGGIQTTLLATANIGECVRDAERIRELSEAASSDAGFATLPKESQEFLRKSHRWGRVDLPDGLQGYMYAILVVGHGAVVANAAVVYDSVHKTAFIVQGSTDMLCGERSPLYAKYGKSSSLCPQPEGAFLEVARNLAKSR